VALVIYRLIIYQQEKSSLLILYGKLPTTKQQLILAVKGAQKAGTPTTQGIADQLNKQSDTKTTPEQLNLELEEAEKVGLIQKSLVNKEDKPAYAWKSLLSQRSFLKAIPFLSKIFK
jgi:hypothetical protein